MNAYTFNSVTYNLDQLVSFAEADASANFSDAWTGKRMLVLTFSSGLRVEVPLSEREKLDRLIRGEP
jgi:hypothetical protein